MSRPIHLRPEAVNDLEAICEYLDEQQPGLSQTFLNQVRDKLNRIRQRPESYGVVLKNVRATTINSFRYVMYFRALAEKVEVLAIIHGHRRSSVWKKRL